MFHQYCVRICLLVLVVSLYIAVFSLGFCTEVHTPTCVHYIPRPAINNIVCTYAFRESPQASLYGNSTERYCCIAYLLLHLSMYCYAYICSLQKIMFINVIVILYERVEWGPIGKGVLCGRAVHNYCTMLPPARQFPSQMNGHLEIIMCIVI